MQLGLSRHDILFREPGADDGLALYHLVKESPPLDLNSVYSYHLLCKHFTDTCIIAEQQGSFVGFISAYLKPVENSTLFIWQVAVAQEQRGKGLARIMLNALLSSPACKNINSLESTVNPSNTASRGLFEGFSKQHNYQMSESVFLDEDQFDGQNHEAEILLSIKMNNLDSIHQEKKYAHI